MAILSPSFEQIAKLKVQPEEGELHLLHFLNDNLDDTFEVYYQPFLNGDRPDIVIMRKSYGVMIIEVKDWDLTKYEIDDKKKWRIKNDSLKSTYTVLSPVEQVLKYKENIYNLHIPNLLEKRIKNYKYWAIVSCVIYFHNSHVDYANNLIKTPFKDDKKYIAFLDKNVSLLGCNSLNKEELNELLRKNYLLSKNKSYLFNDEIYTNLKRYLQPPYHTVEEGTSPPLTALQRKLALSEAKEQRIKGVMGSGKTTILAHRAVSALKRHGENEQVLILTFNITLKNYIHDKISQVRDNFAWGRFYITNYHNLISDTMRRYNIAFDIPTNFDSYTPEEKEAFFEKNYYSNLNLFENVELEKYQTILIDEIQDYKRPWMDMVKKYFLANKGEYVIFGDEKQNIYGNELENKDIKTNISGRPSELKECFRSDERIRKFAIDFQKNLLAHKYDIDDFDSHDQLSLDFSKASSDYINYIFAPTGDSISTLFNIVLGNIKSLGCHPNDIAVLSSSIPFLRDFDCYYRYKTNEKQLPCLKLKRYGTIP